MLITDNLPKHFYNCRRVCLSKNGTTTVNGVREIRPIGVLPIFYKLIEKTLKILIEEEMPNILKVGAEQSGFVKGRSTLENTTVVLQKMATQVTNSDHRYWMFIDLVSAYDNVVHKELIDIMEKRVKKENNQWGELIMR